MEEGRNCVPVYVNVLVGSTPIEAAGNDILNELYKQVFAIRYTLEVLEGIKEIVGGEVVTSEKSATGSVSGTAGGDKPASITVNIGGGVKYTYSYVSYNNLKAALTTRLGLLSAEAERSLASKTMKDLSGNQISIGNNRASDFVRDNNKLAGNQARNAASRTISQIPR